MTQSLTQRWLFPTDHKRIGTLYFIFAVVAMLISWVFSILAPLLQLFGEIAVNTKSYSLLDMFFLYNTVDFYLTPICLLFCGFGNWLVVPMIGAKNMVFPRMNRLSFWLFILAFVCFMVAGIFAVKTKIVGWDSHVPLHANPWSYQTIYIYVLEICLGLVSISILLSIINFITAILTLRTKGMSLYKMPIFVWSIFITAFLLVTVFIVGLMMFASLPDYDRYNILLNLQFTSAIFNETVLSLIIYVTALPALGIIIHVLVYSIRNYFDVAVLFALGGICSLFIPIVMNVMLIGGGNYDIAMNFSYMFYDLTNLALFIGFYYWIGKISGRQYPKQAGVTHFIMYFIGISLSSLAQYFLMTSGTVNINSNTFVYWNIVHSVGYVTLTAATILFIGIIIYTLLRGKKIENKDFHNPPKLS